MWDRLVSPTNNPDVFLHNGSSFTGPTWFSKTTDGGKTWSAPTRVNTPTGQPAFTPSVSVNSAGVVGVTYHDFRNAPPLDGARAP